MSNFWFVTYEISDDYLDSVIVYSETEDEARYLSEAVMDAPYTIKSVEHYNKNVHGSANKYDVVGPSSKFVKKFLATNS